MPLPTMNYAPLTISFTDTSAGDGLAYLWDFGDGSTSTLRNPTHTFQAGAWSVTLTVENENGSDQTSATIVAIPQSAGGGGGTQDDPPPFFPDFPANGKGNGTQNGKGGNGKGGNGKGGNGKGKGKGGEPEF